MLTFFLLIQAVPVVAIYFPESFIKGGKFVNTPSCARFFFSLLVYHSILSLLFQLHFVSSALGFYFVYDFCLYSNMSPLVSYFIRYVPAFVALLLSPAVFILR